MKKYQLNVYWKDGGASGRVIEIAWPLSHSLKDIRRVEIRRYKPVRSERSENVRGGAAE